MASAARGDHVAPAPRSNLACSACALESGPWQGWRAPPGREGSRVSGSQQFSLLARASREEGALPCLSEGKDGAAGGRTWGKETVFRAEVMGVPGGCGVLTNFPLRPVFFLIHKMGDEGTVSYVRAKSLQSCLTLCNPMDCSLPGSSVHGILQARVLEWVAMPSSRGSSRPRD